ncbi:MAG: terminase [Peptoclostridium sp.]|uniref:terminase small subunit n=1 Tax=Peptoclostridium sp. TaxID=1904860 RepID=UPI00139B5C9E|nr:terminase small subunit [Peptoclostridium sp.]MZQ75252.1 terminase [Peptoclostridium sp.]
MARQRSPDSIQGEELYIKSNGEMLLKDIAEKIGVSEGTVRSWKNRYKWDLKLNGDTATLQKEAEKKRNVAKETKIEKKSLRDKITESDIDGAELTENQRLFCLYYLKSFNATMAAIKAGYSKDSAHVQGPRLLGNVRVRAEIQRLKGAMHEEIFIDAMDVLKKYIAIAFADISDYVTFGQKEVQAMGAFGPIVDDDGNPVMKMVNYVDFNESSVVDGTIIKEVKQGKDGVSIKFEDRMKALEKLELYFDILPDKFKRKVEEEKLSMAKERLELDKLKLKEDADEIEDDGFIDALRAETSEVWDDEA